VRQDIEETEEGREEGTTEKERKKQKEEKIKYYQVKEWEQK
jgi:hypothetical protein